MRAPAVPHLGQHLVVFFNCNYFGGCVIICQIKFWLNFRLTEKLQEWHTVFLDTLLLDFPDVNFLLHVPSPLLPLFFLFLFFLSRFTHTHTHTHTQLFSELIKLRTWYPFAPKYLCLYNHGIVTKIRKLALKWCYRVIYRPHWDFFSCFNNVLNNERKSKIMTFVTFL